jgi:hypothetical protein
MTSYPGSGILTQFYGPLAEVTYGVAPSLTGAHFYAIKGGESLKAKKAVMQGTGLFSGALHPQASRRVLAGWDPAGGGIPLELPTRNLQQWLLPMFGSYGQTASALTQDASTGAYQAVHAPGALQSHSFVCQKGVATVDGTVEPFTYVGCKITDWELVVAKHAIAELNLTLVARNELAGSGNADPLNGSVPGLVSYSKPIGGVFHWAQATLYTGGTASTTSGVTSLSAPTTAGNIKSISVKYTTPLDVFGLLLAIKLDLVGPAIGSGSDFSTFELLIPEMFFDGEPTPVVQGTQVVTQKIDLAGLDDGTNNPIQATYWTLDAA